MHRLFLRQAQGGQKPVRVNRATVTGAVDYQAVAVTAGHTFPDLEVTIATADHHLLPTGDVLPRHVVHAGPGCPVDQGSCAVLRDPQGRDVLLHGAYRATVHAARAEVVVLNLPPDAYTSRAGDEGVGDTPSVRRRHLGIGVQAVARGRLDDPLLRSLVLLALRRRGLVRDREVRGHERPAASDATSTDEHPRRLASRLRQAVAPVMVREAFE